jgi:hypothetical protein
MNMNRFRMDQRYLEEGKIEEAIKEKERLEVNQRYVRCFIKCFNIFFF